MYCQMFSVGFNSGLAGGRCRRLMLDGTCSLRVVCQPALSRVSTAWASGGDAPADLVEVMLHGTGIGARKHERSAEVARRTDRTEHIGVGVTLILGLARTRPLL